MTHEPIQGIVVAFPQFAAWLLVLLGGALVAIVWAGGKQMLRRLSDQDKALESIRDLLASEVSKLREMQHAIDVRVTRIESTCHMMHHVEFKGRGGENGRGEND